MIYELITPSDQITFLAGNDKIAIAAAVLLGQGKAGCKDESGKSLPTMYIFHPDPLPEIEKDLGMDFHEFVGANKKELAECFQSFAYTGISNRKQYDDSLAALPNDTDKLAFKKKHEDKNRTSMSQWVKQAWKYAEALLKKETQTV